MRLVVSQYCTSTAVKRKKYLHNIKQLKMAIKRRVLMVLISCSVRCYGCSAALDTAVCLPLSLQRHAPLTGMRRRPATGKLP